MKKRLFALLLVLAMMLGAVNAYADSESWACTNCGQEGNTGNFCSNCGAARPDGPWACANCGQEGNTGNFCSNCGAAKPNGNGSTGNSAAEVSDMLEQIPDETDRVKVLVESVQAGTFITNKQDPTRWAPENAVDGDESTCWQFSAKKIKSAWISLHLKSYETIDEIWIKNGFWAVNDKGKDQYPINARLKKIKVEFIYSNTNVYEDTLEITLADDTSRSDWQRFEIEPHEYVEAIKITPVSVYKGSAFPNDVCLSEVMLVKHAPAETAMPAQQAKDATVYESRPDITGVGLLQKLATRSGPGTQFAEPGTFFANNWKKQTVLVKKKSYVNGVWWVQVDFQNGTKSKYRVWTGAKRVDVDLNKVKEDKRICDADVYPTTDTYFGPGGKYAKANISINRSAFGRIFAFENGYVDIEYWYEDDGYDGEHRLWIPESAVYNLYYGDYSGEN